MTKFFVEYSIGDTPHLVGNIFIGLPTPRISVEGLREIIKRIAHKEACPEVEVFIDNIAKINSN